MEGCVPRISVWTGGYLIGFRFVGVDLVGESVMWVGFARMLPTMLVRRIESVLWRCLLLQLMEMLWIWMKMSSWLVCCYGLLDLADLLVLRVHLCYLKHLYQKKQGIVV